MSIKSNHPPGYVQPPDFQESSSTRPPSIINNHSTNKSPTDMARPEEHMEGLTQPPGVGVHYHPDGWDTLKRRLPSSQPHFYQVAEMAQMQGHALNAGELDEILQSDFQPGTGENPRSSPTDAKYNTDSLRFARTASSGAVLDRQHTFIHQLQKQKNVVRRHAAHIRQKKEAARDRRKAYSEAERQISFFYLFWLRFAHFCNSSWEALSHRLYHSAIWHSRIKEIEGSHGTHVGIYFNFLRWCLILNVVLGLIWVFFVVSPFVHFFSFKEGLDDIHPNPRPEYTDYNAGELIVSWFTGMQPLNHSAYFIGSYYIPYDPAPSAGTFDNPIGDKDRLYRVPLAYVCTGGGYMMVSFILVFLGLYRSWVKSAVSFEAGSFQLGQLCLTTYDHTLTSSNSIKLHQKAIAEKIKESLGERALDRHYAQLQWSQVMLKRIVINTIILGTLAACIFGIIRTVEEFADSDGLERLIPAIVMALINAAVPFVFEILAEMEDYRSLLFVIKITVLRSILLRFVSLYAFMITLYRNRFQYMCWESFVGQGSYTLFVAGSLVFEIFTSGFIDIWVTIIHKNVPPARLLLKDPAYFDTIKKILELTYAQAVIWFGSFFSPLLPLVGIARCIVLFYVQKWSTMTWCTPKGTPFQAGHSLPWLIWSLLAASLFIVALPLGYLVAWVPPSGVYSDYNDWFLTDINNLTVIPANCTISTVSCADCLKESRNLSETVCYKPDLHQYSKLYTSPFVDSIYSDGFETSMQQFCSSCPSGCGPFRNMEFMISPIQDSASRWPNWLQDIVNFMGTAPFTLILIFVFLSIFSCMSAQSSARRMRAEKMRVERDMERLDKLWILREYNILFQPNQKQDDTGAFGGIAETEFINHVGTVDDRKNGMKPTVRRSEIEVGQGM
eukprot:m.8915 g.8915  ORF g.8915 m.8915 type:complete len:896 (-) comp3972_c0_seq1:136-2823(-)